MIIFFVGIKRYVFSYSQLCFFNETNYHFFHLDDYKKTNDFVEDLLAAGTTEDGEEVFDVIKKGITVQGSDDNSSETRRKRKKKHQKHNKKSSKKSRKERHSSASSISNSQSSDSADESSSSSTHNDSDRQRDRRSRSKGKSRNNDPVAEKENNGSPKGQKSDSNKVKLILRIPKNESTH